jgi:hypothetical protein
MRRYPSSTRKKTPAALVVSSARTKQFDQLLLAYALAGAGVIMLTPTAGAEIVYTPADVILTRGLLQIDLDHDGTSDLRIINREHQSFSSAYVDGVLAVHGNAAGVAIVAQEGYFRAYALPLGFPIGPDSPKPFVDAETRILLMANAFCYPLAGASAPKAPQDCNSDGFWKKATQRFLGLRFELNGETHYGWARFSTTFRYQPLPLIKAHLTGYAYETEPNKTILAGDTGLEADAGMGGVNAGEASIGTERAVEGPTLGLLSLGSIGMDAWRQRKQDSPTASRSKKNTE